MRVPMTINRIAVQPRPAPTTAAVPPARRAPQNEPAEKTRPDPGHHPERDGRAPPPVESAEAPELPARQWHIMFFMNGLYGDLEPGIARSFLDLERPNVGDTMYLTAQIGRARQGRVHTYGQITDRIDGDWKGVRRYEIRPQLPERIAARKNAETEDDYAAIAKKYPENPLAHYYLGKFLEERGRRAEALPHLNKAGELGILTLLGRTSDSSPTERQLKKRAPRWHREIAKATQAIRNRQGPHSTFASQKIKEFGLGSMFTPKALKRFVKDNMKSYPAERHAVVMMAHGGAWMGASHIPPARMRQALMEAVAEANAETGRHDRLDLLVFNSCYMGNLETLHELDGAADLVVASEDSALSSVFSHWGDLLERFRDEIAAGRGTPEELARTFVEHYRKRNARLDPLDPVSRTIHESYDTLAAVDLRKLPPVVEGLARLAKVVEEHHVSHETFFRHLRASRNYPSHAYRFSFLDFYEDLHDLGMFLERLSTDQAIPEPVRAAAASTRAALSEALLAENHAADRAGSTGLSIWAPTNALNFMEAKGAYQEQVPRFLKKVDWLTRFRNATREVPKGKLARALQLRKRLEAMPPNQDPRLKAKLEQTVKNVKAQLELGMPKSTPRAAGEGAGYSERR